MASGLLLAVTATASEPPALKNNPFSRPPTPEFVAEVQFDDEPNNTPLLLVATIVSSHEAFANVDGTVLRPGDEIDGYLLKHVYEDHAVFARNGDELTVYVKPELDEDDEPPTRNRRRR